VVGCFPEGDRMMNGTTKQTDGKKISKTSMNDILYLTYFRLNENKHSVNKSHIDDENTYLPHDKQSESDSDDPSISQPDYVTSSNRSNEYYYSMFFEIGI
jgi:hypothetical protein